MDYWVETALRPLRHYADFRGRSTRSELVAFYVLMSVANFGLLFMSGMLGPLVSDEVEWTAGELVHLAFLCPILALSVRRFHDQGRSAWWLLLAVPALAANIWQSYAAGFSLDPFVQLEHQLPWPVSALVAFCLLALMALLLWKDEEGTNRYGPNPRYDEPEEAGPEETAGGMPAQP